MGGGYGLEPDGTYLLWVDFRSLGLSEKEREKIIACIVAMPDKAAAKDTESKEFLAKTYVEHQGAVRDALKAVGGVLLLIGGYAAYRSFRDDRRNARELGLNSDLERIPD